MKLIFVYNAGSGLFNLLSDAARKIISPKTYPCNLCALTHSNFGMKKEWKNYLETLDAQPEFLHADEFARQYPAENARLPAIFKHSDGSLTAIADADSINECESIDDLKNLIKNSL
ncbi:MAG: hypothetical protein ACR2GD_09795 [Pyrinomonadaceae bacterium]